MATAILNDVQLYYECHGPEQAPALVLNNGILMNAATSWVFQTRALAAHYHVIQYDCRGQGQSDHPAAPYSMAQHAHDLAGLLTHLGVERAHIAGISYGGEVAQSFALSYPERVLSLILADTVSEVGPELRITATGWRDLALAGDAVGLHQASVPWNFAPEFIGAHPKLIADSRERYRLLDLAAVARLCDAFLAVDFTGRLGAITVPTCIIVGELDRLKGRAYADILHRAIPHSELHLIPGAGHVTCWERAEAFNTIILGFLAKREA